ncbi:BnaA01g37000D [Brassica napus]|uniref:BnaA01g37000D protein n=1 Tax=Brassica napus TaxID=3708 RepID=A0A078JAY2_BRANA|nr:BnaA01g37000D [Brassica napus]
MNPEQNPSRQCAACGEQEAFLTYAHRLPQLPFRRPPRLPSSSSSAVFLLHMPAVLRPQFLLLPQI